MNTREKCIEYIIDSDGTNKSLSPYSVEKIMITYKRGSEIDLSLNTLPEIQQLFKNLQVIAKKKFRKSINFYKYNFFKYFSFNSNPLIALIDIYLDLLQIDSRKDKKENSEENLVSSSSSDSQEFEENQKTAKNCI